MGRYVKNVAVAETISGDDVRSLAEHARKLVDDQITLRLGRSAGDLNRLAEVLRTAGARLEGTFTAPYFEGAATQIDRAADLLKNASTAEIADAVQRAARGNPLLFIGGALALGFGAGRFLRSSGAAVPALTSGESPVGPERTTRSARPTATRKQRQPSFSNTRDES